MVGNRKTVLPRYAYGDGIRKIDLCAALLVIVRPLLQQARINRAWLPSEIFPKYVSVAEKEKTLQRLRFTFTPNGKRDFVPRDQVFPLIFPLLFIVSTQK